MKFIERMPNLITFLNVLFGFAAVASLIRHAQGYGGGPVQAAWFIVVAAVLDAMDGKLARALGRQSRFGMELDALSDAISFGLAPSALLYTMHFSGWAHRGPIWALLGFLVASMPLIFGTFRLARFNAEVGMEDKKSKYFAGLPIPAAAGLIASYVLFCNDILERVWTPGLLPLTLLASLLMVSRVSFEGMPYFSLRQGGRNLTRLTLFVLVMVSILFLQSMALFPAAMIYLVMSLVKHLRQQSEEEHQNEREWGDNAR
ncbi:MAG: CDP-alcohol phosphatidyltransferase family protein [Bdellovibrionales bacterium]|nr:CDP-alcohol phosphatidyltransferase family protein [Bdellovibrionales bacterium]